MNKYLVYARRSSEAQETPDITLAKQLTDLFGQYYKKQISERIKRGLAIKKKLKQQKKI
jgi:hypothetical protein